jgi:pimeloyl-ACP methyl ester carboxylesterase
LRTLVFLHGLTIDGRDAAPLARALPEWTVVALALPGHGAPAVADWHPRAVAAKLALPEGRFSLVGHSWGAALAVWLATLHAERVDALVLLDGGWFDRRDLPSRPPPSNPDQAAAFHALFASPSSEAWPRLRTPTLAIAGAKTDAETKDRLLSRFLAAVPHARGQTFPHLGHDLLRDGPEEVSRAVRDWLVRA